LHSSILEHQKHKPIKITLTASNNKHSDDSYIVFNIPFPPSYIFETENISLVTASGEMLYFFPEVISRWNFMNNNKPSSIRSLKVFLKKKDYHSSTKTIQAKLERHPKYILVNKPNVVEQISTKIINIEFENGVQSINIKEPKYYATYEPDWLSACLFRTKTQNTRKNYPLDWFDQASTDFSETLSNALNSESLTFQELNLTRHRAWQYDLAATLYNTYIKTGELKWLKLAHKAAQIYAYFVNSEGAWTLKHKPDLKFSYNLSMFIDYLFFGDISLLKKIEAIADYSMHWKPDYKRNYGFWTERHQTYSLLAATVAWEATANKKYSTRAVEVAEASVAEVMRPESPWTPQGCLQHEFGAHDRGEGGESKIPVCSPWMSALLADAVLRYFIQSGDHKALYLLYELAEFIINHGIYITDNRKIRGYTLPRYFAFPEKENVKGGSAHDDKQHACDVAGLLGKGLFAAKLLNNKSSHIRNTIENLMKSCRDDIERSKRKAGKSGKDYWRIKPPRKFSWVFGTTSDLSYFYSY